MALTLTTLDDYKLLQDLDIAASEDDDRLCKLLEGVEAAVLRYLDRGPTLAAATGITEYHDGTGRQSLYLDRRPVTAVTSVHVDAYGMAGQASGAFGSSTEWDAGTHFYIDRTDQSEDNRGHLVSMNGLTGHRWPAGNGNIKVVYSAGYTTIPQDLANAVAELAVEVERDWGGPMESETIGRYTYRLATRDSQVSAAIANAKSVLNAYRVKP